MEMKIFDTKMSHKLLSMLQSILEASVNDGFESFVDTRTLARDSVNAMIRIEPIIDIAREFLSPRYKRRENFTVFNCHDSQHHHVSQICCCLKISTQISSRYCHIMGIHADNLEHLFSVRFSRKM